ncbi:hypothetical protein GCM10027290_31660 [Micromonospora sonneratiae]|uniref:LuxR C-terminal-related transcriptional regulator n=1 Tax=Micromonospora sonneratiae TaxID=1184706 RepID=A0ABW3YND2_9ACTN
MGRRNEIDRWEKVLDRARGGRPSVVDVVGEPGVGKTTLLAAFAERARAQGIATSTELPRRSERERRDAALRVLLLDDVERAPGASTRAVAELLDRPPDNALVVVLARRTRQTSPWLLRALGTAKADSIALCGLAADELSPLGAAQLCSAHRHRELRQADGNPQFVKTLAAWCAGPGKCAGGPLPEPHLAVPGEAAGTRAEIAHLPASSKLVCHAAAVAADIVDPALLSTVAQLSQDEVLTGIDDLLAADLIRPVGSTGQLRFRTLMTRWVCYASAPGGWRFGAHLRALRILRERGEPADLCAVHVERTGRVGDLDGVRHLVEAARLTAPLAPHTAAYWYSAALRLLHSGAHAELYQELDAERSRCATQSAASEAVPEHLAPALHPLPAAGPSELHQLSCREYEVAVLVSRGRTNQQIARALGLSHKTIETHLSRVFTKLNVCSRAEVANLVGRTEVAEAAVAS